MLPGDAERICHRAHRSPSGNESVRNGVFWDLPRARSPRAGSRFPWSSCRACAPHATRCCLAGRSLRPCGASLPESSAYGAELLRESPPARSSWDYRRSYASLLHKREELSGHFGAASQAAPDTSSTGLAASRLQNRPAPRRTGFLISCLPRAPTAIPTPGRSQATLGQIGHQRLERQVGHRVQTLDHQFAVWFEQPLAVSAHRPRPRASRLPVTLRLLHHFRHAKHRRPSPPHGNFDPPQRPMPPPNQDRSNTVSPSMLTSVRADATIAMRPAV